MFGCHRENSFSRNKRDSVSGFWASGALKSQIERKQWELGMQCMPTFVSQSQNHLFVATLAVICFTVFAAFYALCHSVILTSTLSVLSPYWGWRPSLLQYSPFSREQAGLGSSWVISSGFAESKNRWFPHCVWSFTQHNSLENSWNIARDWRSFRCYLILEDLNVKPL